LLLLIALQRRSCYVPVAKSTERLGGILDSAPRWGVDRKSKLRPEPLTVTVREAKELSGLGWNSIWNAINDGRLKITRVGRRVLIHYDTLKEMLGVRVVK
jgi:excisionase family DNA binding protein